MTTMTTRLPWDDYLLRIASDVAARSPDPATKHGTVIVDAEHAILATGYNGPPRGCRDELIPLTRPEKYAYLVHSEANAVASAARRGVSLLGSTAYVTGPTCAPCLALLINAGVREVVTGSVPSACVDDAAERAKAVMLDGRDGFRVRRVGDSHYAATDPASPRSGSVPPAMG
jgi:dCMP deaminase